MPDIDIGSVAREILQPKIKAADFSAQKKTALIGRLPSSSLLFTICRRCTHHEYFFLKGRAALLLGIEKKKCCFFTSAHYPICSPLHLYHSRDIFSLAVIL